MKSKYLPRIISEAHDKGRKHYVILSILDLILCNNNIKYTIVSKR